MIDDDHGDEPPPAPPPSDPPAPRKRKRSRRDRGVARAVTWSSRRPLTSEERMVAASSPPSAPMPESRDDCRGGPRPCPIVRCKWNLYLDVDPRTGSIKLNYPGREPEDMPPEQSCAADIFERGLEITLDAVGALMNMTRERVRQIEVVALVKLGPEARPLVDGSPPVARQLKGKLHLPREVAPCERCSRMVMGKKIHRCIGVARPEVAHAPEAAAASSG